ncbi:hypothetical protein SteCoe_17768 [Stentor coeruleus]|uniref:Uncharacterized protein n=1 Tax=Stentor coeruleus TaxID=5963 RepID=A0A1R2BYJ5_9CILI|nr:hypothetical protein SteCoe_17768 [Stentor coeruleus]
MQSPSKKVNLHLSRTDSIGSVNSISEKPSSHTDFLVEANFLQSVIITDKAPDIKTTNLQKIKALMQKTSDKLNIHQKPLENANPINDLIEKNKEILYLKGLIRNLESEKKELIEKNHELTLIIQHGKKSIKDHDADIEKAIKNARMMISKAKEINSLSSEISNTIGETSTFIAMIKAGNIIEPLTKTLKFILYLLTLSSNHPKSCKHSREHSERKHDTEKTKDNLSNYIEDDISNLLKESNILGCQINKQKHRVHDLFRKIECSVEKSKNYIESIDSLEFSTYTLSPQLSVIKSEGL